MSVLLLLLGSLGTLALVIGLALGSVLWRALGKLISNELEAVVPELANGLLEKAIKRLPVEHRDRLGEEWRRGLKDSVAKRPLLALAEAASLYKEAGRISGVLEPSTVPVSEGGAPKGVASRLGHVGRALRAARMSRPSEFFRRWVDQVTDTYLRVLGVPRESSVGERIAVLVGLALYAMPRLVLVAVMFIALRWLNVL